MRLYRRTFRRLGAVLWTALSMVCITAGILVGLARLLMPFAPQLEPHIEEWLSGQFNREVRVEAVGAEWETAGPVLRLAGVRIGGEADGPRPLVLEQAEVGINPFGWLLPGTRVTNFRIARTDLVLVRAGPGDYRLEGLGGRGESGDPADTLEWLLDQGSISLVDSRLTLLDPSRDVALNFSDIAVTLDNRGLQHRLVGRLQAAQQAGEIGFQLQFSSLASRPGISAGRLYVEGQDVSLHRWLAGAPPSGLDLSEGAADFRIWGDWGRNGADRIEGELAFRDLLLGGARLDEAAGVSEFAAGRISLDFLWERVNGGWQFFGENLAVSRRGRDWPLGGFTLARHDGRTRLGADYVHLRDFSELAQVLPGLPVAAGRALSTLQPGGEIRRLRAAWSEDADLPRELSLEARLAGLSWEPWAGAPGASGISGDIRVDGDAGRATLRAQSATFRYPRLFRQPIALDTMRSRLSWQRESDGWHLDVPNAVVETGGARLRARLGLHFQGDGTRPVIDLRARVNGGDASLAGGYLPVGIMHPDLVRWLDRALVGGRVVNARATAYGDLDHWPFDNPMGRFEVRGLARDATLDYRDDWPRVEDAEARMLFQGRSMRITATGGRVFDARAERVVASIDNLKWPILELDIRASGPSSDLLRFLRESPLNERFAPYASGLTAEGTGRFTAKLDLPLKDALDDQRRIQGQVHLEQTRLANPDWGIAFDDVSGRVQFDDRGFVTEGMSGLFRGEPVALWLSVGDEKFPDAVAEARLSGALSPAKLLADFPLVLPVAGFMEGRPDSLVTLRVPRAEPGTEPEARLTLSSDLQGVAVNLPAPLAKQPAERVPLTVELPVPYRGGPVRLFYGERLAANLHPGAEGGFRGHLRLGNVLPSLPRTPGLLVEGTVPSLDLDEWLAMGGMLPVTGGGALLKQVSISAQRVSLLERTFRDLTLEARPGDGRWTVALEGPGLAGSLELPSEEGAGLVADFQRLQLPEAEDDGRPAMPAIDPRQLPSLHMLIEDFTLGGTNLGRTRLEAYPVADGLRVDMLKTESESLALQAAGDWTATDGGQRSEFELTITAENLGGMLSEFGYAGLVQGGQTVAQLDVSWPGAPADFSLSRVSGDLEFRVGEGRIVPVEPGAGRIFGLLSLQALPRRLTLDFSDLFQSGLSFDAIQGNFSFSDGDAYTDNLTLSGPSALIRVVGRVGLSDRVYDQRVTVIPSVGNTLPLVGALAGGPAGAAAMFVLQNLFEEQLGEMASYQYAVTGSWEDPQVRQLETPAPPEQAARRGSGD